MSEDYRVDPLSDAQVRAIASRTRALHPEHVTEGRVDVRAFVSEPIIQTKSGRKKLRYEVLPDSEMSQADAITSFYSDLVHITARRSVDTAATFGQGRSRSTLGHELGHAVLHSGPPMARGVAAVGRSTMHPYIESYRSAEHQAKVFSAAFLIDDQIAAKCEGPDEISAVFGVSLESARITWERLTEPQRRAESFVRVEKMAGAFLAERTKVPSTLQFVQERCSTCGESTLFPIGTKFLCNTCGDVSDRFQDGDRVTY